VANEVVSYLEMCSREGTRLQRRMNFGLGGDHSVVLISVRPNAPYRDRLEDMENTLFYESHDELRSERRGSSSESVMREMMMCLEAGHPPRPARGRLRVVFEGMDSRAVCHIGRPIH